MSQNDPQDPGQQPPPGYQPPQGYPQPDYQQQNYQQPYGQGYGAPVGEDPGKTLGIVGLILSFFTALIGMIISIVAFRRSKKAGFKNTPALVGIIVGAVTTLLTIVGVIIGVAVAGVAYDQIQLLQQACAGQPSGTTVRVGGTTFTCP